MMWFLAPSFPPHFAFVLIFRHGRNVQEAVEEVSCKLNLPNASLCYSLGGFSVSVLAG